jgi:hypothetical protein
VEVRARLPRRQTRSSTNIDYRKIPNTLAEL